MAIDSYLALGQLAGGLPFRQSVRSPTIRYEMLLHLSWLLRSLTIGGVWFLLRCLSVRHMDFLLMGNDAFPVVQHFRVLATLGDPLAGICNNS